MNKLAMLFVRYLTMNVKIPGQTITFLCSVRIVCLVQLQFEFLKLSDELRLRNTLLVDKAFNYVEHCLPCIIVSIH
jgi:hypothetical protein